MNRNIFIIILLLSIGASRTVVAQETNSGAVPARTTLLGLAQKNIFDPTRSGGPARYGSIRRAPVVRTFTFNGSDGFMAVFTGAGTPRKGYVERGDSIDGFKVMKITLDYVTLAEPNGNLVKLMVDETMRQEEDGPWKKSDQPAPAYSASTETKAGESTAASGTSSPPSASAAAILEKLRQRHKQEE